MAGWGEVAGLCFTCVGERTNVYLFPIQRKGQRVSVSVSAKRPVERCTARRLAGQRIPVVA